MLGVSAVTKTAVLGYLGLHFDKIPTLASFILTAMHFRSTFGSLTKANITHMPESVLEMIQRYVPAMLIGLWFSGFGFTVGSTADGSEMSNFINQPL